MRNPSISNYFYVTFLTKEFTPYKTIRSGRHITKKDSERA